MAEQGMSEHLQQLWAGVRTALRPVLPLVARARLAAPANEEQHGDSVDACIGERKQGIDGIAQPRVLHVDERGPAGAEVIADGRGHRAALVRGDEVFGGRALLCEAGDEVLQQRVRHAGDFRLFATMAKQTG